MKLTSILGAGNAVTVRMRLPRRISKTCKNSQLNLFIKEQKMTCAICKDAEVYSAIFLLFIQYIQNYLISLT